MSYESTDYRHQPETGARVPRDPVAGDRRDPMYAPTSGGSTKGLLIAVVVLLALVALFALFTVGGDPVTAPPGLQGEAPHAIPSDGTVGGADVTETAPAPAPQLGEEAAPATPETAPAPAPVQDN